uniref:phospholipase D n=1 Tax=Chenopodium quinoa TaxID=63459 RepID=A0A803MBD7_CHEQI
MAEDSEKMVYLHGDLDLTIHEARDLPNMDITSERLRLCFTACNTCCSTPRDDHLPPKNSKNQHRHRPHIITSDPYVAVVVPQATIARTRVLKNSQDPEWNEHFIIPIAHPITNIEFQVKDDDVFGAQVIGIFSLPASRLLSEEHIKGWQPIYSPSTGKPPKPESAIRIDLKYTPCERIPDLNVTLNGVKSTYFPLRKGSLVKLYQDSHGKPDYLPEIKLDGGEIYKQNTCWEDICYAICEAHHMIYIVGWSVFHKVKLVREPTKPLPRGGDLILGDLLKYKSEEGVREGVMQTHDEETRKFFKHSSVNCVLSPRYGSSKLGYFKQQVVGTLFTHHQKCVLVDTQASGNNRKVTAFIGGIDLCDGRYDTPEHRLFRDLDTVFKDDFHNPTFPAGTRAPRQPWHDLHCRIDGPAAYDVLINFEQRWKKATKFREFGFRKKMSRWHDDSLIKLDRISWILSPKRSSKDDELTEVPKEDPELWVSKEGHSENWHVQIFRSIDSGSLRGFPKTVSQAKSQGKLESPANLVVDGGPDGRGELTGGVFCTSDFGGEVSVFEGGHGGGFTSKPTKVSFEGSGDGRRRSEIEFSPLRVARKVGDFSSGFAGGGHGGVDVEYGVILWTVRRAEVDVFEGDRIGGCFEKGGANSSGSGGGPGVLAGKDKRGDKTTACGGLNERRLWLGEGRIRCKRVRWWTSWTCWWVDSKDGRGGLGGETESPPMMAIRRGGDFSGGFTGGGPGGTQEGVVLSPVVLPAACVWPEVEQKACFKESGYLVGSSRMQEQLLAEELLAEGADNMIPMELALKIVSKIRAKERFAVYIIIPMWPEGDPKSAAVQEILYWQSQTMQMMYEVVARELKTMQLTDLRLQDYLNFYCLGNREEVPEESLKEAEQSSDKISDSYKYRRFMIYVHAKGMIVDDEYVLMGSANINQRSLAGTKDTEIAMGAYQPHHTWANKKRHPKGQVYGYRSSLWAEHLGMLNECFDEPESVECVRKVNEIAEDNWKRFTEESFTLLQGHLLKYPLQVDDDGKVESLPNQDTFPDLGGKILGVPSNTLPDVLTT